MWSLPWLCMCTPTLIMSCPCGCTWPHLSAHDTIQFIWLCTTLVSCFCWEMRLTEPGLEPDCMYSNCAVTCIECTLYQKNLIHIYLQNLAQLLYWKCIHVCHQRLTRYTGLLKYWNTFPTFRFSDWSSVLDYHNSYYINIGWFLHPLRLSQQIMVHLWAEVVTKYIYLSKCLQNLYFTGVFVTYTFTRLHWF